MLTKTSERIAASLPFILILLAGVTGIKSNVDLFSWSHFCLFLETSTDITQHSFPGDR